MLHKAHMTSHSRMSGSRWDHSIVISWLWRSSLYSSSVYSCHLFLISSASHRSIPFLPSFEYSLVSGKHMLAWWGCRSLGKEVNFYQMVLEISRNTVSLRKRSFSLFSEIHIPVRLKVFLLWCFSAPIKFRLVFINLIQHISMIAFWKWKWSHSVVSDSLRPHGQ